jgi:hypothetical protein
VYRTPVAPSAGTYSERTTFRQSGKKAVRQEFRLEKSGDPLDSAGSGGNVRLKLQDAISQTYSQFQVT